MTFSVPADQWLLGQHLVLIHIFLYFPVID